MIAVQMIAGETISGQTIVAEIKGGEDAARLRQRGRKRGGRERPMLQKGKNRFVGDAEQGPALLGRKFGGSLGGLSLIARGQIFSRLFRQLGHRSFSAGLGRRNGVAAFPICGQSATRRRRNSRVRKPAKAEP